MINELFPRAHVRLTLLPLLGPLLEGFAVWLVGKGLSRNSTRARIQKAPAFEMVLSRHGDFDAKRLSRDQLLSLGPPRARDDIRMSSLVRSLADYLGALDLLAVPARTPGDRLLDGYREYLLDVRGLAASTVRRSVRLPRELLAFLEFDEGAEGLRELRAARLEEFVKAIAPRFGRASLLDAVSSLRVFLRFLASRGESAPGLDRSLSLPRVYRAERLPRALPWDTVRAFLASIDPTARTGQRDYAMFLMAATYGLRCSEIASLRLDDIRWQGAAFHIQRPKARSPIHLPLTREAGTALLEYLRRERPASTCREVFLRSRRPIAPLSPKSVSSAFLLWKQRGGFDFAPCGPHCLRHSLAVRLLRQNTPLKTIGDLLGHRSPHSTEAYLRLNVEDLREAALDLPSETGVPA